jgi:hypothetical protein
MGEKPPSKKNPTESVLDYRLRPDDSPETTDARTDAFEKLMEGAEEIRKAGFDPNDIPGYQKARREYEKLNETLDDFEKGNDTEKDLLQPQIQRQYEYFVKKIGEDLANEIASRPAAPPAASLEALVQPEEVPVVANPIDREAEQAKLKAVVAELQGVDDPHDSWDPKAFKKYEKEHAAPAPAKPRKRTPAAPATPVAEGTKAARAPKLPLQAEKDPGTIIREDFKGIKEDTAAAFRNIAERADARVAAASAEALKKFDPPAPPKAESVPPEVKKPEKKAEKKLEELPLAVPVGEPYTPEGVKTNAELKKEFFANKEKPTTLNEPVGVEAGKETGYVKSMAEQMYEMGQGGELIRRVAEREIAKREKELATQAARMGGAEFGFLSRTREKFKQMPHKKKLLAGAALLALLGAAALNEPAVVSGFEHALRTVQETGQSAWHGFLNWLNSGMMQQHGAEAAKGVATGAQKAAEHAHAVPSASDVLNMAANGHGAAEVLGGQPITPEGLREYMGNAPQMQLDPSLTKEILSGYAGAETHAYLLHDGRISVFGGDPSTYGEFAKAFAHKMGVDVTLPVNLDGVLNDLIVHADGTSEFRPVAANAVPIVENIVLKLP